MDPCYQRDFHFSTVRFQLTVCRVTDLCLLRRVCLKSFDAGNKRKYWHHEKFAKNHDPHPAREYDQWNERYTMYNNQYKTYNSNLRLRPVFENAYKLVVTPTS